MVTLRPAAGANTEAKAVTGRIIPGSPNKARPRERARFIFPLRHNRAVCQRVQIHPSSYRKINIPYTQAIAIRDIQSPLTAINCAAPEPAPPPRPDQSLSGWIFQLFNAFGAAGGFVQGEHSDKVIVEGHHPIRFKAFRTITAESALNTARTIAIDDEPQIVPPGQAERLPNRV